MHRHKTINQYSVDKTTNQYSVGLADVVIAAVIRSGCSDAARICHRSSYSCRKTANTALLACPPMLHGGTAETPAQVVQWSCLASRNGAFGSVDVVTLFQNAGYKGSEVDVNTKTCATGTVALVSSLCSCLCGPHVSRSVLMMSSRKKSSHCRLAYIIDIFLVCDSFARPRIDSVLRCTHATRAVASIDLP